MSETFEELEEKNLKKTTDELERFNYLMEELNITETSLPRVVEFLLLLDILVKKGVVSLEYDKN